MGGGPAPAATTTGLGTEPGLRVLTWREKLTIVGVYTAIAVATVIGFLLLLVVARSYALFLPLGVLSYTLGLRHGVDADHISAIDNTTRKLLQQKQRPLTVGSWFSLGHSTIVIVMIVALVVAFNAVNSAYGTFTFVGTIVGTAVSAAFLWIIGLINLVIVFEIYRIFQGLRAGELSEQGLEEQLNKRGFMNRYFGGLFRVVNRPWQMYPVGVLFGLGFDTATEIGLLGLSASGASRGLPLASVLVFPVLFAAGMSLIDTTDNILMLGAYGWAFIKPVRKLYYNLTITFVSVVVAIVVGGIEALGLLADRLHLNGAFWTAVLRLNVSFGTLGYLIIGLFALSWIVSIAIYKWRRFDDLEFGD